MICFDQIIILLKKYKEQYGDCLVPHAYTTKDGIHLGWIVASLRSGNRKTTDEQKARLNNLGFVWKIKESSLPFEQIIILLKKYKEQFGNCLVPQAYDTEEGIHLGWIVTSLRSGNRKTTDEQKAILNNLGFVWNVKESTLPFDQIIILLKKYKEQFGNYLVPRSYITEDGIRLGWIVSNIRAGSRHTTEYEKAILNNLGFVWKIR